jgi:glycosyltransferase involved in cell wall biosynthesis
MSPENGLTSSTFPAAQIAEFLAALGWDPQSESSDEVGTEESEQTTPFLSVVMRTRGTRALGLAEALNSLGEQEDMDFEVVLVAHEVDSAGETLITETLAVVPEAVRSRLRRIDGTRDGRAAPLNDGFAAACGRYIAVLDDDDIVYPNWVAAFRQGADDAPGQVIRTVAQSQVFRFCTSDGAEAAEPVGDLQTWPDHFNIAEHLYANYTPFLSVAIPREVFHLAGLRFDESLSTAEDWEFLIRVALLAGVESRPDVTCLYRLWDNYGASREEHSDEEWDVNDQHIRSSFHGVPILLPVNGSEQIQEVVIERDKLLHERETLRHATEVAQAEWEASEREVLRLRAELSDRGDYLRELLTMRTSWAWWLTAPLRGMSRLMAKTAPTRIIDYAHMDTATLRNEAESLHASRSLRLARRLRLRRED